MAPKCTLSCWVLDRVIKQCRCLDCFGFMNGGLPIMPGNDHNNGDSFQSTSSHSNHDMDATENSLSQPYSGNGDNSSERENERAPRLVISPVDSLAALDDVSDITESLPDDIEPSTYVPLAYRQPLQPFNFYRKSR